MKKVLLALALATSVNFMAQANTENVEPAAQTNDTTVKAVTTPADGFIKTENTTLPSKLSDAVKAQFEGATIKEVFVNNVTETFRVIIATKDGKDLTLTLTDKSKNDTESPATNTQAEADSAKPSETTPAEQSTEAQTPNKAVETPVQN